MCIYFQVCICQWALDVTLIDDEYCSCGERDKTRDANDCWKCNTLFEVTVSPCQETDSSWPFSVCSNVMKYSQNLAGDEDGLLLHFTTTEQPMKVKFVHN